MTMQRLKIARNLDWNLLKIFYEIAEAQGVTSAANLLWRKQSTISLALKRLEIELGVKLCSRGPAGFELTDEGIVIYDLCKKIYGSIREIPNRLNNISEEIHGEIKFLSISNFINSKFDELIIAYNKRCPHVELVMDVAPWENIPPSILRHESDIGITPISVIYPELQYDYLCDEHHRVFCGRSHHLFGKTIDNPNALIDESFVLTGNDEPEQLTKFRLKHGIGNHVAGVTSHLEEAKRLTSLGIGISFLPETYVQQEIALNTLWPLTPRMAELSLKIFIVTHSHFPHNMPMRCFLDEVHLLNSHN